MRFDFTFPRNYEVRLLESAPLIHPLEKLYHYPVELEEGDRTGAYVRVVPNGAAAWNGFFAKGFDSNQVMSAICSCPDPNTLCVIIGGYAYVVNVAEPERWEQIEQRPVVEFRTVSSSELIFFVGFTSITALGKSRIAWTTERLSWEGIAINKVTAEAIHGHGWDAISDKQVPFQVDLRSGAHTGGARPSAGR